MHKLTIKSDMGWNPVIEALWNQKHELQEQIRAHEDSIDRLLAFACGEKEIKKILVPYSLVNTMKVIKELRAKIKTLRSEIKRLGIYDDESSQV